MTNKIPNGTHAQKSQLRFLIAVLLGIFVLVLFIFLPFLYALIFAAVFSIVFQPVYKKIIELTRGRRGISAFATIFIVLIFIFTPIVFLGIQIFQETQQLYLFLMDGDGQDVILNIFNDLMHNLQFIIGESVAQNLFINIDQYLKQGIGWLLQNLGIVFFNFVNLLINAFVFLIVLYYLFKDGPKIKKTFIALSPLADIDNEIILKKLESAVNSVIKGRLIIAIIQGALAAVGFIIFGIPNAMFWGSVTIISALIPGIGAALVIVPAIIFLFFTSGPFYGFGLLVWGIVVVGLVDNLLNPKLVSIGMQLHPLIIFLSVFGGMMFFGPVGFLFGPLILSLFFTLLDIYFSLRTRKV